MAIDEDDVDDGDVGVGGDSGGPSSSVTSMIAAARFVNAVRQYGGTPEQRAKARAIVEMFRYYAQRGVAGKGSAEEMLAL